MLNPFIHYECSGILSGCEWGFVSVGFCPVGFCPVGFCQCRVLSSGVLSVWDFVLWGFVPTPARSYVTSPYLNHQHVLTLPGIVL